MEKYFISYIKLSAER